jgi:hypothetical protein
MKEKIETEKLDVEWERWDKEIEADSEAGKLDFLVRQAADEKAKRTLKSL